MPTPRLQLLGGFRLTLDGEIVSAPRSAQRLLVFLALQRQPLLRVFVAGSLWLESDEDHANASLRSALWRVHRLPCTLVHATSKALSISDELVVDVAAVNDAACDVLAGHVGMDGSFQRLCEAGELLPDWYEEWLVVERERVRQLRLHALDQACRMLTGQGRYAEAAQAALASVAAEPLRESAHRALIELHLAEGNLVEAVRQFETFRLLALLHLGVEPSRALRELVPEAATYR